MKKTQIEDIFITTRESKPARNEAAPAPLTLKRTNFLAGNKYILSKTFVFYTFLTIFVIKGAMSGERLKVRARGKKSVSG